MLGCGRPGMGTSSGAVQAPPSTWAPRARSIGRMTRYVIGPDVAVHLAQHQVPVRADHRLVAPTLLRSQVLSLLYTAVARGELTKPQAEQCLDDVRGLRIRLLGD